MAIKVWTRTSDHRVYESSDYHIVASFKGCAVLVYLGLGEAGGTIDFEYPYETMTLLKVSTRKLLKQYSSGGDKLLGTRLLRKMLDEELVAAKEYRYHKMGLRGNHPPASAFVDPPSSVLQEHSESKIAAEAFNDLEEYGLTDGHEYLEMMIRASMYCGMVSEIADSLISDHINRTCAYLIGGLEIDRI